MSTNTKVAPTTNAQPIKIRFLANFKATPKPPASRVGRPRKYEEVARQLKARPGQWAIIIENCTPAAADFARGWLGKGFEVEGRTKDGSTTVYARNTK